MKTINKLAPLLVYALIFSVSIAIAQSTIPITQQKANLFEYGHYENNRQDMILDTLIKTTVEVKVYEDILIINSQANQSYTFGSTLEKRNTEELYYVSMESIDQDGDLCNVIIHYDKISKIYKITIAYNNIYIRYYM